MPAAVFTSWGPWGHVFVSHKDTKPDAQTLIFYWLHLMWLLYFVNSFTSLFLPFLPCLSLSTRTWHWCPCSRHEHRREGNVLDRRHICEHYCTYCEFSDLLYILYCRQRSRSVWLGCSLVEILKRTKLKTRSESYVNHEQQFPAPPLPVDHRNIPRLLKGAFQTEDFLFCYQLIILLPNLPDGAYLTRNG